MKKLAALLVATLTALALLSGHTPAQADIPPNVHDGKAGTFDRGWVRAACATSEDGAKCAIRFPKGAGIVLVKHLRGGQPMSDVQQTFTSAEDYNAERFTYKRVGGYVVSGIRIKCARRGQVVGCSLDIPQRFRNINTATIVKGYRYNGLLAQGLGPVAG